MSKLKADWLTGGVLAVSAFFFTLIAGLLINLQVSLTFLREKLEVIFIVFATLFIMGSVIYI